jgi:TolB-like protein
MLRGVNQSGSPCPFARACGFLLVLALAVLAGSWARAVSEPRVAVLDFQGAGANADTAALGLGLQSMLTTDLAQVSSLVLVERARLRDIERELKLSRSKLVDASTAVRIGKLAGATHLVMGSYTVVKDKMRLDGRLVAVSTGKVVLAESAEGELEAFFELEKTLVNKIIEAIGVKVPAKERGAVARIHTTDLAAFREFAAGIQLFDEQKYDASTDALRAALKKDDEFKLARSTLADYERFILELRSKATDIELSEAESQRLSRQESSSTKRKAFDKLLGLTASKDRFKRAAAIYMLACAYGSFSSGSLDFPGLEDFFANRRARDALAQKYYPDALALFPKVPLNIHCLSQTGPDRPESLELFDKQFDAIAGRLEEGSYSRQEHMQRVAEMARMLHLDLRGEADLADRFFQEGVKAGNGVDWQRSLLDLRAALRHQLLEFDQTTRLLKQSADLPEGNVSYSGGRAGLLRSYASAIEKNAATARYVEALPKDSPLREIAMLRGLSDFRPSLDAFDVDDLKGWAADPERLNRWLWDQRQLSDKYVVVSRSPVWKVRGPLWTGRRLKDPLRAEQLYYHAAHPRDSNGTYAIIDGVPRKDLAVSFELFFAPPKDFYPDNMASDSKVPDARRPSVVFLFGAQCVECDRRYEPKTGGWDFKDQPMTAQGFVFESDRVRLVNLSVSHKQSSAVPTLTTLAEQKLSSPSAGKIRVSVTVRGGSAVVTLNDQALSYALSEKRALGFYGLLFVGPGFTGLQGLSSNTP